MVISDSPFDVFEWRTGKWSGLEWHRSLNVVVMCAFVWSIWRWRTERAAWFSFGMAAIFVALATGLGQAHVPVGTEVRDTIFRPALFGHVAWFSMCMTSAVCSTRADWSSRTLSVVYGVFVGAWLIMVRSHPAYPSIYVF